MPRIVSAQPPVSGGFLIGKPSLPMKLASGRNGSWCDRPPFGLIAGKRSVKFRFPEATIHHRVLTTLSGSLLPLEADIQRGGHRPARLIAQRPVELWVRHRPGKRNNTASTEHASDSASRPACFSSDQTATLSTCPSRLPFDRRLCWCQERQHPNAVFLSPKVLPS